MRLPFNGAFKTTQSFNDACCRASYAKFGMQGHNGIDYGLPCGTPVVAAFNGTVYSGNEPNGYGNYIFLRDSAGNEAVYGHLSKIQVGSGRVAEGQQIGLSGTTGNSTGCHLHFGYRPAGYNRNNGFLGYVNPTFNQGGKEPMINDTDNEFARWNDLHRRLRGRSSDRATFRKAAVGRSWLSQAELLSDDVEANNWFNYANTGLVATRDNWQGQITTLQKQFADATKVATELQTRLAASDNTTKALTEKVDALNKRVTELDNPDNIVVSRSWFNTLFDKLKGIVGK